MDVAGPKSAPPRHRHREVLGSQSGPSPHPWQVSDSPTPFCDWPRSTLDGAVRVARRAHKNDGRWPHKEVSAHFAEGPASAVPTDRGPVRDTCPVIALAALRRLAQSFQFRPAKDIASTLRRELNRHETRSG